MSEPVREAETIRRVAEHMGYCPHSTPEDERAGLRIAALLDDRDRLAGEAETYRDALERIAAHPHGGILVNIARAALSDSKEAGNG